MRTTTAEKQNTRKNRGLNVPLTVLIVAACFLYYTIKTAPMDNHGASRQPAPPGSVSADQTEPAAAVFGRNRGGANDAPDTRDQDASPELFLPTASTISRLKDFSDLRKYLYYIDETAYADETLLDIDELMAIDVTTDISAAGQPKVLIFHTHSQEWFSDSAPGEEDDTIVGVGSVLADILAKEYGIGVVHDFGQYDIVDGEIVRGASYERMEPSVRRILEKYPSIEIMIDLHRDGVPEDVRLVTEIGGEKVARLMFFNGVVCENVGGDGERIDSLPNPYLRENLALSLKMQLAANELYPGLTRMLYLKPYRYSLHMRPKSLLVEAGANTNTIAEAKAAMRPLAKILYEVIK